MSYKDRIQTGSFRNVDFEIDAHTFEGGRRVVLHEFPERDEPFAEDMGRRGRSFVLEVHIIDDDYFSQRDRLIRALERKDYGILIHPYLGRKEVQCTGFSVSENVREGRIVYFTLNFVERGKPINPTGIFSKIFGVFDQINETIESLREDFQAVYEIANLPGYVADRASDVLNEALDTFNEAIGVVPQTVDVVDQIKNDINDLRNEIPSILGDSGEIFDSFTEVERELTQVTNDARDKQKVLEEMLDFGDDQEEPPILTDSREAEQDNNKALYRCVQGIAIIDTVSWFVQSVSEPFDSTDEEASNLENNTIFSIGDLQERRDEIVTLINDFVDKFGDFDSRYAFIDLKAKMLDAIPQSGTSTDLNKEQNITLKETLPSLWIVYDQFETITSEQDFIDRNRIQHPAYVQGGVEYEIVEIE